MCIAHEYLSKLNPTNPSYLHYLLNNNNNNTKKLKPSYVLSLSLSKL